MIKQDLLDYELHLNGKHIADFDDLDMAKSVARAALNAERADDAVIINKWTGEVLYNAFTKMERKVVVDIE